MPDRNKHPSCPWFVVPADDKENASLIVSRIVLDSLGGLKMSFSRDQPETQAGIGRYPQSAMKGTPGPP